MGVWRFDGGLGAAGLASSSFGGEQWAKMRLRLWADQRGGGGSS